jgi:hypothetical protein
LLSVVACATPTTTSGPYARGVSADAPPDTVGILFTWTPSQTIVDVRNIDHIFPTHTVRQGDQVRPLPRAAVQIDPFVTPVTVKGEGAAMSLAASPAGTSSPQSGPPCAEGGGGRLEPGRAFPHFGSFRDRFSFEIRPF